MAIVQKITGSDEKGAAFPLRVATFPHAIELAKQATDVVEQIEIDGSTNGDLLTDLTDNTKDFDLQAGVLTKKGQVVLVAGDGGYQKALKALDLIEAKADAGSFTNNTERDRAIGALARIVRRLVEQSQRSN